MVKKYLTKILLGFGFLSFTTSPLWAQEYRLYSSKDGLKPFYWAENGQNKGIIPDIVESLGGVSLKLVETPHKRISQYFMDNRLDLAMLHPDYTQLDDQLSFIALKFNQENILFTRKDNPADFSFLEEIENTSVCAREGYVYLNMSERWQTQSLRRENLRTNEQLLQMLKIKRCDFAIGSRTGLNFIIKEKELGEIKATDIIVNQVPRFLAVSKRHGDLHERLERHINALKTSGKLDEILKKYAP